jgi:hypothetical protein
MNDLGGQAAKLQTLFDDFIRQFAIFVGASIYRMT